MEKKVKVLFVGSFLKSMADGGVGGQMYACKVLTDSKLSEDIDWIKIDSTAESNVNNSMSKRIVKLIKRLVKLVYYLFFSSVDCVLIFTAAGFSFKEKGLMALISKFFGKKVIIAPRSGGILADFKSSRKNLYKKVFEKVDVIVCQSETWKNTFSKEFPDVDIDRFKVIYNGVDTEDYQFKESSDNNRASLNLLFLAWVDRNKGIYELISACEKLKQDGFDFNISICGNGKDFDKVSKYVLDNNLNCFIKMEGWIGREKKMSFLSKTDLFVLPSYFEGMPNALLEAMAVGVPAIATSVGAIPDVILDKENGYLIEPKNSSALYQALKVAIENPERLKSMRSNARQRIERNHSLDLVVSKYSNILIK